MSECPPGSGLATLQPPRRALRVCRKQGFPGPTWASPVTPPHTGTMCSCVHTADCCQSVPLERWFITRNFIMLLLTPAQGEPEAALAPVTGGEGSAAFGG